MDYYHLRIKGDGPQIEGDGPRIEGGGFRMKSVTPAKLTDFAAKIEAWQNAAARAVFEWMAEYKQFARTQFKDQPASARRLRL